MSTQSTQTADLKISLLTENLEFLSGFCETMSVSLEAGKRDQKKGIFFEILTHQL